MLGVGGSRAVVSEKCFLVIAVAVALGVATEVNIGRLANQHAIAGQSHRPGNHEVVEKNRAFVVMAIVLRTFQPHNPRHRRQLIRPLDVRHIRPKLDDINPSIRIKRERDRLLNQRLSRDKLGMKSGRQFE